MTQKELLYMEDAIGHEDIIIKVLEDSMTYVEDDEINSFFKNELKIHEDVKKNLIKKLEELC